MLDQWQEVSSFSREREVMIGIAITAKIAGVLAFVVGVFLFDAVFFGGFDRD